jgi:predicted nuclease of predicted toxin-antitoxin system
LKIKIDENMPNSLAEILRIARHDVDTVSQEKLSGAEDPVILENAGREGRIFMTFDLDFCNIREYPEGTHAGIVVFRLHDQRWEALSESAGRLIASGVLELLSGGLAVVDESRIRLRECKRTP